MLRNGKRVGRGSQERKELLAFLFQGFYRAMAETGQRLVVFTEIGQSQWRAHTLHMARPVREMVSYCPLSYG